MDLLLPVLLVALAVWTTRRVRRRLDAHRARAELLARPGASADNPLVLSAPRVLEEARAALRCACGGQVRALGETPRLGLRVARGRCVACDADVDLYFVLPTMLN